jgi:hypothetical protein
MLILSTESRESVVVGGADGRCRLLTQRVCREIQATWSPQRRVQRERGLQATWWTPPIIRLSDLIEAVNRDRVDNPL